MLQYIPPPTSRTTTKKVVTTVKLQTVPLKGKGRGAITGLVLKPDLTHIPELYMKCTKIAMGSLEGSPNEPLHIAISGVDISLESKYVTRIPT